MMAPKRQQETENLRQHDSTFWDRLYDASYADFDQSLTSAELRLMLVELELMLRHRQHLAVVEMPLDSLDGKTMLEIGSGAGAHSAMFSQHGAHITAMDMSPERVTATSRKLDLLSVRHADVLQGNAETLPYHNDSFDIVYSNGVLHHTPDTEQAIREIFRVLKPGGRAAVMLYAKNSLFYLVNLWLVQGVIRRKIERSNWLGHITEWMSPKPRGAFDPVTKVYSSSDIFRLFSQFQDVHIRKNSFHFSQLGTRIGNRLQRIARRNMPLAQAGRLVWGEPHRYETGLELWLGQWLGFGLNILAFK